MTKFPISFRTNESKYNFAGETKLINSYVEAQGKDAKDPMVVLPAYGMTLERAVTDTPQRGAISIEDATNDCIYTVHATSVYKVEETGAAVRVGTVPGNDVVQMSRNQAATTQISIHCAAGEFYIENDIVKQVTDEDLPTAISQDQLGGYTLYGIVDGRFFISSINACQEVDGTDYATAEQTAAPLVRIKADGDLFLFKKDEVEQWRNTGNADFPFEPIGTPIKHGLLAPEAVTKFDNTLLFVGKDNITYRIVGTGSVQRVSTHGIERSVANEPDQDSIVAFTYPSEGHTFGTITGSSFTRSYDAATQFWHSRESYQLGRWRARNPINKWGKVIVGDELSGNLYYLDKNAFVEGSDPLIWGMDTPIFHIFPNGGIVDALYLDVATGVGLSTGQGSDPKLMLSWSTDGGNTFKGDRELSLGVTGDRVRIATRRLGRFGPQGIVFRIRVSDPVIRAIVGMDVKVRPLKR
jgi:hypothetical protein